MSDEATRAALREREAELVSARDNLFAEHEELGRLRAERDRMVSAHGLTMEERDAAVEARDKAVALLREYPHGTCQTSVTAAIQTRHLTREEGGLSPVSSPVAGCRCWNCRAAAMLAPPTEGDQP